MQESEKRLEAKEKTYEEVYEVLEEHFAGRQYCLYVDGAQQEMTEDVLKFIRVILEIMFYTAFPRGRKSFKYGADDNQNTLLKAHPEADLTRIFEEIVKDEFITTYQLFESRNDASDWYKKQIHNKPRLQVEHVRQHFASRITYEVFKDIDCLIELANDLHCKHLYRGLSLNIPEHILDIANVEQREEMIHEFGKKALKQIYKNGCEPRFESFSNIENVAKEYLLKASDKEIKVLIELNDALSLDISHFAIHQNQGHHLVKIGDTEVTAVKNTTVSFIKKERFYRFVVNCQEPSREHMRHLKEFEKKYMKLTKHMLPVEELSRNVRSSRQGQHLEHIRLINIATEPLKLPIAGHFTESSFSAIPTGNIKIRNPVNFATEEDITDAQTATATIEVPDYSQYPASAETEMLCDILFKRSI